MAKLLPHVRKHGFKALTMDEISKIMGVSRATLYKYFSTKEEIIEFIVETFIVYILDIIGDTDANQVGARFQQIFGQSVLLMEYITDIFLMELESNNSVRYERLKNALIQREQQITKFYNDGIREGIFNDVSGKILIAQDEILRTILDVRYLLENNLTVEKVLWDYYNIKKYQLFKPDKLQIIDDSAMMPKIAYMAQKITKNLF
jgi:AcrR family transcriptional regulator